MFLSSEVSIGDFAALRDLGFLDEKDSVSTFDASSGWAFDVDAMAQELAPFIGNPLHPYWCRGVEEELLKRSSFA